MTVASSTARVSYSGNGSTKTFAVNFYFLEDSHLQVVVRAADGTETVKTLTTDYTVTGAGNPAGGSVVFGVAPLSTETVVIVRSVPLTQQTDYLANDPFPAESHEEALDKLTMISQQQQNELDQVVRFPVTDDQAINSVLPASSFRANKLVKFDASGNIGVTTENYDADLATVAANIGSVNTTAGSITNVNTVAGSITNVNTVAGSITNVNNVCGNISNVLAVDANETNINAVAADLLGADNIGTVANIATEVGTVAGIATEVAAVDANETNISTVAADLAGSDTIGTVAGIATEVATVAGIATEIVAVDGNATNINTVAADLAGADNIGTVAGLATEVAAVAGISTEIVAVDGNATNINTVATDLAGANTIGAVVAIATDVTTVAGVATDIPTVAGIASDIPTVALNVADITNFADVYQGPKTSDPTTRNDSSDLQAGDLYFNTVDDVMKVYEGDSWIAAFASLSGALIAVNNLSDLTNVSAAQQNLDLEPGVDVLAYDSNLQSFVTTFTLPTVDGTASQVLSTNGSGTLAFSTVTSPADVFKPTNVSPADEATNIGETPTLEGSPYYSLYGKAQKSSQWQVSTSSGFGTTVYDSGEVLGVGVTHAVPAGILQVSETYYWRVRYRDIDDTYSEYSTPTEFDTAAAFNNFIATPTATPANFGDSFEGGFYTGLIWNQVTQSATSTAIGTGSKTFTVTDAAPLFYSGQTVEVRSRANPSTQRMIGTVTASQGTTLTVNVTSVDGSGTYTDWSVMARYRVIVAPKSSGDDAGKTYKNANTAAPSATGTLTEGLKATLAMVAADTSTVYPAAHWANNLTINTYSDWYVPARDELELCWRNLKPTTNNNYTTADRPNSPTPNYTNLGSIGTGSTSHGVNNNSSPQGAAYTTAVPARTSVAAFQTGGAEAFEYGSSFYWSSTEYSASDAWSQYWGSSLPGRQGFNDKSNTFRVRAVRRSII